VYYQCRSCRHQTTLLSGTPLAGTKLPFTTWLLALYRLAWAKTNLSALELMRHWGVNYKSAWRIKHKAMQVMAIEEAPRRLDGFVQMDDAYLGGERNGGKTLEHPRYAVLEPVTTFDDDSLLDWCTRRLAPEAEVYSDGLACFTRCIDTGNAHTVLVTQGARAACEVRGARWVNVLLGNAKRAISGCYHAIKQAKYARRYLAEVQYRFNRRFHLATMLPRLMRAMMRCKPWPGPALRAAGNFYG